MGKKAKYLEAMESSNYPLALTLLDQAIAEDPQDPVLFYNFAICCFQTKNFSKTVSILRDLLDKHPGFIEVERIYRLLAFSLIEEKKWAEAEATIKARLEIQRNDLQLLSFLAHVFEHTHRIPAAIEVHRQVLLIDPEYLNSLNSLGYLLALQDNRTPEETKEAVECLKKALSKNPDNPAYLDSFGYLLKTLGNEEAALKAFQKGLQKNPSHPVLLERLKSFG